MATPSGNSIPSKTFTNMGNLVKLLPTGTVFMFEFLNPVLTNDGHCNVSNKYMSGALLVICAFMCCFSCFTDSYIDSDGMIHYGIATSKGLCPSSSVDTSSYKLRIGDFVHAFFSLGVFAVVALLDSNTTGCFYPSFEKTQKVLYMTLPTVIGTVSSFVFMFFPNKRHGIGYRTDEDHQEGKTA
ncbi:hypothetical protein Leryth_002660 [Lithospermum erythrorhizon]|uniref:Uncharacterized protein n=1 Tax=Lithospermum erythrorhizon TaxID=34254 RepID=A0AAV3QR00_LITER|nr:hypothetical protein Leryth_002660 [Lithospermum erythrorhizon]